MRAAVVVFPASNCDQDVARALEIVTGTAPEMVWHGDSTLPDVDLIVLPGGFSYGDYLRCGAMAAKTSVMRDVVRQADSGTHVLGICNGFQILLESGLLPGAMLQNANLKFVCRDVHLKLERRSTPFTRTYADGSVLRIPVAHHEGNYFASDDALAALEDDEQIVFRYTDENANATDGANPNGSRNNIAGIINKQGNVLGLMPHPERAVDPLHGGVDGLPMFQSLLETLS